MNKENIETILELTPMQQGMLYHSLYTDGDNPYVYQYASRLQGRLKAPPFIRAWRRVVDRHQILRASFFWKESDKPLQVISRTVELPVTQQDWRHLAPAEQEKRLESFFKEDRERGFDLGQAPLMRLSLIRLADEAQELIWTFHHILLDGWSVPLLLREIFIHYKAFSQHRKIQLPPPRAFGDFIAWLQKQDLKKAESFWRRALAGVIAPTRLPFDGEDVEPVKPEVGYAAEVLYLSEATTSGLNELARRSRLTMSAFAQGAWALLLGRYSGRQDVVFGTVVSGRPPELEWAESIVGLLINTLPTRARVDAGAGVIEWLQGMQAWQAEGRRYEYSPLALVQGWSDVRRGTPLFESIVAFENFPAESVSAEDAGELKVVSARSIEGNNYPLALIVLPGRELGLTLVHNTQRFARRNVSRLLGELRETLEKIIADPTQTLAQLMPGLGRSVVERQIEEKVSLLTPAERERILYGFNSTDFPFQADEVFP
ncbi:MAG TPA: condensation domain-containing protein, partial [Blastocatellia bacterium]|nr:condensation domain-containing protein [Blastocatellia bacterium]